MKINLHKTIAETIGIDKLRVRREARRQADPAERQQAPDRHAPEQQDGIQGRDRRQVGRLHHPVCWHARYSDGAKREAVSVEIVDFAKKFKPTGTFRQQPYNKEES